jgi:CO dehydrogenase maturation factor
VNKNRPSNHLIVSICGSSSLRDVEKRVNWWACVGIGSVNDGESMLKKNGLVIAVSGKGGVGKTTTTALMAKILSESQPNKDILVIDANPDSNLPDVLGVQASRTVGMVTDDLQKALAKSEIPPTVSKQDVLETRIFEILRETPSFDLLVMGRGEGEGCYCAVNAFLAHIIDRLVGNYDLTLIDMEAGLEHLSRRTDRDVDVMLVVTDPSSMGLLTAKRIKEVAREVHIDFKRFLLIGNRFSPEMESMLASEAERLGYEFVGLVPVDDNVFECNLAGKPLLGLPDNSPSLVAVKDILKRIGLP